MEALKLVEGSSETVQNGKKKSDLTLRRSMRRFLNIESSTLGVRLRQRALSEGSGEEESQEGGGLSSGLAASLFC